MMTVGFYTNQRLAGEEIRFTEASNAFRSLAYVVAGNGCGPLFSEIPCPPTIALFWMKTPVYGYRLHSGVRNLSNLWKSDKVLSQDTP
jgi:hypothetical protein